MKYIAVTLLLLSALATGVYFIIINLPVLIPPPPLPTVYDFDILALIYKNQDTNAAKIFYYPNTSTSFNLTINSEQNNYFSDSTSKS